MTIKTTSISSHPIVVVHAEAASVSLSQPVGSFARRIDVTRVGGAGRGEYRRSYGNSARGSRGGYNRSGADPNAPDLDNALDFPTLPKQ